MCDPQAGGWEAERGTRSKEGPERPPRCPTRLCCANPASSPARPVGSSVPQFCAVSLPWACIQGREIPARKAGRAFRGQPSLPRFLPPPGGSCLSLPGGWRSVNHRCLSVTSVALGLEGRAGQKDAGLQAQELADLAWSTPLPGQEGLAHEGQPGCVGSRCS